MIRLKRTFAAGVAAALALLVAPACAADGNEAGRQYRFATPSGLVFYSGPAPTVSDSGVDALFVAGGTVVLDGASASDMFAAGGDITTEGIDVGDLYLAGGRVEIAGTVNDDVIATGGRVTVRRNTTIAGDGIFAGGQIRLQPTARGDIAAAGGRVELGGSIDGTVTIVSPSIVLDPGTRIGGDLVYRSEYELVIPQGVSIGGKVVRREWPGEETARGAQILAAVAAALGSLAALVVFAAAVVAVLPLPSARAAAEIDAQPLRALGLGLVILIGVPVAAVVLMFTLVGVPLALFVLVAYALLLGLGLVSVWYWVGSRVRGALKRPAEISTTGQRVIWTLAGLILFVAVGLIPFLGTAAQVLALIAGLGGVAFAVRRRPSSA